MNLLSVLSLFVDDSNIEEFLAAAMPPPDEQELEPLPDYEDVVSGDEQPGVRPQEGEREGAVATPDEQPGEREGAVTPNSELEPLLDFEEVMVEDNVRCTRIFCTRCRAPVGSISAVATPDQQPGVRPQEGEQSPVQQPPAQDEGATPGELPPIEQIERELDLDDLDDDEEEESEYELPSSDDEIHVVYDQDEEEDTLTPGARGGEEERKEKVGYNGPVSSLLKCKQCQYTWNPTFGWICPVCRETYVDLRGQKPVTICTAGHHACTRCQETLFTMTSPKCPTCRLRLFQTDCVVHLEMSAAVDDAREMLQTHVDNMSHTADGTYCYLHAPQESLTLKTIYKAMEKTDSKVKMHTSKTESLNKKIKGLVKLKRETVSQLTTVRKQRKRLQTAMPDRERLWRLDKTTMKLVGRYLRHDPDL